MTVLVALCHSADQEFEIKRVEISQNVAGEIGRLFSRQLEYFLRGVEEEIEFNGDWKPDEDELLYIALPEPLTNIVDTCTNNTLELPTIDAAQILSENIRALAASVRHQGRNKLAIQKFSSRQILENKFSLILRNQVFNRLEDPILTINDKICAVVDREQLKFTNFGVIKTIFDLTSFYHEASDQEIDEFSEMESVDIPDIDAFKAACTQTSRKLLHAIQKSGALEERSAAEIRRAAEALDVEITVRKGRIVFPTNRKELRELLSFLDDGLYRAHLSGTRYLANSKRKY